jgi:hypothetical protein
MCIVASIIMLVKWRSKEYCYPFLIFLDDDDNYWENKYGYRKYDYCREGAWATVSFILAIMYFVTSGCIFYFIKSGRHAEWEQKLQLQDEAVSSTTATNIEMGTVEPQEQSSAALATATATATAVEAANPHIPPDASGKIDDVA